MAVVEKSDNILGKPRIYVKGQSKAEGKDQEFTQSSTTPYPRHHVMKK